MASPAAKRPKVLPHYDCCMCGCTFIHTLPAEVGKTKITARKSEGARGNCFNYTFSIPISFSWRIELNHIL